MINLRWRAPDRIVKVDGHDYMQRWVLFRSRHYAIYLHRFVLADGNEQFHDHPWDMLGLVLRGGYVEEYQEPHECVSTNCQRTINWVNRFRYNWRHRIKQVLPGTITLCMLRRRRNHWHFYDRDGKKKEQVISQWSKT